MAGSREIYYKELGERQRTRWLEVGRVLKGTGRKTEN